MIDEPQTYTVSSYELSLARNKSVSFYRVVEHDFLTSLTYAAMGHVLDAVARHVAHRPSESPLPTATSSTSSTVPPSFLMGLYTTMDGGPTGPGTR
jgi:hypothetical protein